MATATNKPNKAFLFIKKTPPQMYDCDGEGCLNILVKEKTIYRNIS
jgi:hypothetical protein